MLCRYMLHMVATGEDIVHTKMLESFCINCFADIRDEVVSKYEHRKQNWQEENELVRLYQSREVAVDAIKRPVGFFIPAVGIYNAAKKYKNSKESRECKEFVCNILERQCNKEIANAFAKRAEKLLNGNFLIQA